MMIGKRVIFLKPSTQLRREEPLKKPQHQWQPPWRE
jgi:hypothetical protein